MMVVRGLVLPEDIVLCCYLNDLALTDAATLDDGDGRLAAPDK